MLAGHARSDGRHTRDPGPATTARTVTAEQQLGVPRDAQLGIEFMNLKICICPFGFLPAGSNFGRGAAARDDATERRWTTLSQTMSRARAATLALAMVVSASAAGVMKTCRDMNASASLAPPPLPAAASSLQFHEVERLRKHSSTVIWTHCGSNYTICQNTVPRWRQYARSFGYDLLVLRERNPSITGIATHAWDRVFVAQQLLGRGYEWAMHVDGDTAILDSRLGIHEFARRTGCSSSAFLYLSQDVGKHGSLRAPCGPNNFGVFILRNGAGARAMLEHVTAQSQRPGRFWQARATARNCTCTCTCTCTCGCHMCVCVKAASQRIRG